MEFLTTAEFAKRLGVTAVIVQRHCKNGKYPGAYQEETGRREWKIPAMHAVQKEATRTHSVRTTDTIWNEIAEKAGQTKHSINEFLIRKALDLPIMFKGE